jgi:hypothetical protein
MARLMMVVLWPSFLVAIVAEGFFFSLFDPYDLSLLDTYPDITPLAVYTVGFFCFWLFCALASMLTCYLMGVPKDLRPPF